MKSNLERRIARERKVLNLRPWQLAPSEIDDGPCPYPPSCAGFESWHEALKLRNVMTQRRKARKAKPTTGDPK